MRKVVVLLALFAIAGSAVGQWSRQPVDSSRGLYPAIAVNASGQPAIVHQKGVIWGGLVYTEHDGAAWQRVMVDSANIWIYEPYPSLCFDLQGRPHIAYYSSSPRHLKHAWREGAAWQTAVVDSYPGTNYLFTSIVADNDDNIHIAYSINGGSVIRYAVGQGASWTRATLFTSSQAYSGQVSVDVDAQNHPHIVSGDKLYLRNLGSGWLIDTLTYTPVMGTPNIRFDSQNHPQIMYYSTNLYRLWHNGAQWLLDTAKTNVCYTTFDLDASDKAHVVHSDYGAPCSLSYTTNSSGSWATELISATKKRFGPRNFQVAAGPGGAVHVCDYDSLETTTYLYYSHRPGTGVEGQPGRGAPVGSVRLAASPNPFSGKILLTFRIPQSGVASLKIYNLSGRHVRTLSQGHRSAGSHQVVWDGTGANGQPQPSGVYLCRLVTAGGSATQRILKLR